MTEYLIEGAEVVFELIAVAILLAYLFTEGEKK